MKQLADAYDPSLHFSCAQDLKHLYLTALLRAVIIKKMKQDKIHCLDEKVSKPLTYKQALAILREMHFGACVIRSGRNRGSKRIWWTTEKGENYYQMFLRETSWEYIIEVAKQQLPVWDNAMLFEVGDVIDFEWFNGRKCQGTILERDDSRSDYLIESLAFLSRRDSKRRVTKRLTNYDLKFYRKAVYRRQNL
jgi:hypothetical protein